MAANVLKEIGLSELITRFKEQKIDSIEMCCCLNDSDLSRLGLETIGERIRFREGCDRARHALQTAASSSGACGELSGSFDASHNDALSLFRPSRSRWIAKKKTEKGKTWTGNFVCLSDKNTSCPPLSSQKLLLQNAGLGSRKITFSSNTIDEDVRAKLISTEGFPKLKNAGGFEIMKCLSNCRQLDVIKGSWNVEHLKIVFGSQCKIYIRPIQHDLDMTPLQETVSQSTIQETCTTCGKKFPISDLRQHVQDCSKQHLQNSDTENDFDMVDAQHNETAEPSVTYTYNQQNAEAEGESIHVDVATDSVALNMEEIINYCLDNNIEAPKDILCVLQQKIVQGRALEIKDETEAMVEGNTNFIIVSRENILQDGIEELANIQNPRLTLEVQFAGEAAVDLGGPRKEFFRLMLQEVQENYFSPVKEWSGDYEVIGKLFGLSLLQNGTLPRVMNPELIDEVFMSTDPRPFVRHIRKGLDSLGLFKIVQRLPSLIQLFTSGLVQPLTLKMLTQLLTPKFSENGSNRKVAENRMYRKFLKYMKEIASGRRESCSLEDILLFVTGADTEPLLGFTIHPCIIFVEAVSPLPTANTCVNKLNLSISDTVMSFVEKDLFDSFDLAFANSFYGLQ